MAGDNVRTIEDGGPFFGGVILSRVQAFYSIESVYTDSIDITLPPYRRILIKGRPGWRAGGN